MNDRAVALLEQYDVEILRTRKGRGVILSTSSMVSISGQPETVDINDKAIEAMKQLEHVTAK